MPSQEAVHCSFCDSTDVTKLSIFGTAQLVSQYYCHQCKSVFEFIRWQKEKETNKEV
ncbi:hypothetical protein PcaKH16_22330 [Parageobacillus caldoxylosilyticus]|uniref:PaaD zinc beta ribbon domain-containing protein n=1 Tax=Parageobacillus caldoxylosilyticus NBRC 107762 TaxID=1220594 RepID=A0A023DIU4_9BACL|nr:hypothetical protein PcaKH16_22330 [Parageobacillus caldoxylosilyticus]GAJ41163.1 hypothetical protein GCA01S_059_00200 [Parageobacillus caldoxylosilyticus NBRC 107762]